jgi:hypothetical protein
MFSGYPDRGAPHNATRSVPPHSTARCGLPGDPNPWIVSKAAVERYLTVAEECGKANLIAAQARAH